MRQRPTRPLLAAVRRIAPPQSQVRNRLSALLAGFPGLHALAKRLAGGGGLLDTAAPPGARKHTPSDQHPVLNDPRLLTLERPKAALLTPEELRWTPASESLEPVLEIDQMRQGAASLCFVLPVRDAAIEALELSLQSVLRQTEPGWELLFACRADEFQKVGHWLEIDWRVRRIEVPATATEAQCLIAACEAATTVFVGLLSAGDVADDDLVKAISKKLRDEPELDLVYTDEANRMPDGAIHPFHKPDWSPEHQQSVNLLGRFTAVRKKLLLTLPDPAGRQDAAAEYGLALAAADRARGIGHIDELLYLRGRPDPQAALGGFFPPAALEEARSLLEQQVRTKNSKASVEALAAQGSLRVRWPEPQQPVTLLILTGMYERDVPGRGKICLATHFVQSIIRNSSARNYKILVIDDGFLPDDLRDLLAAHGHSAVSYPKQPSFSFAHKANFATAQVREGIVILLNDDLEVIAPDWIQALASQAARPEIGVAGGKLLFPDGSLQHAGIALGFHGSAGHMFHRASEDGGDYAGFAGIDRNYSAVTGAVMAYRKEVFDRVGGFDLQFATDYNDLDFCLKCVAAGYRVVYTPAARLYHFHNSSFNRSHDKPEERDAFLNKWARVIERDPYFSRHFQRGSNDLPLLGT